jgi:hypothetical protein
MANIPLNEPGPGQPPRPADDKERPQTKKPMIASLSIQDFQMPTDKVFRLLFDTKNVEKNEATGEFERKL